MHDYLVVHGRARITEGGAPELLQQLAQVYVGPGTRFSAIARSASGFIMRITPERITRQGPWLT
jgi:hypothetical protein